MTRSKSHTQCAETVRYVLLIALIMFWVLQEIAFSTMTSQREDVAVVQQLAIARNKGHDLRLQLVGLGSGAAEKNHYSQDTLDQLRQARAEYYRLRESLFRPALLHASSIVQRLEPENKDAVLRNTATSIFAASELVKNFHAVAIVLNTHQEYLQAWNTADPHLGIPPNSWTQSLRASHNTQYRDVFRAGLRRLQDHRDRLDTLWEQGDQDLQRLFPTGLTAFLTDLEQHVVLLKEGLAEENLSQDQELLRSLVEQSKQARVYWMTEAPRLRAAIEQNQGLIRGDVRLQVYAAESTYLALRKNLYHLAFTHLPKLTRQDIPYPPSIRTQGIGMSLLAAISLYENTRTLQTHVLTIPGVRTLLNQGDPGRGIPAGFWDEIHREFVKFKYRSLLEEGLEAFHAGYHEQGENGTSHDAFLAYVHAEIETSHTVVDLHSDSFLTNMARKFQFYVSQAGDFFTGGFNRGKFEVSKGFGNLMGLIELRKGKLSGQADWEEFVGSRLHPGDILLEKTPFRLTDRFIPGHFGHAAIYVGGTEQLRRLGLASNPLIRQYLTEISSGHTIVEALRDGTQLSDLEHFLNIDDLAILRPKPGVVSKEEVREAISLAFSHIGKAYDFNFDTNTWDAIVCSELIFQTYIRIPWTYDKVLSSYTISPDDIAIFAGSGDDRPLTLVTFIHDGDLVHDLPTGLDHEDLYIQLLGDQYPNGTYVPTLSTVTTR